MTATNVLLWALIMGAIWFGAKILERLPKPGSHGDFTCEIPEFFASFRIDSVTEIAFEVSFVDDWSVGRPFWLYGPPIGDNARFPAELKLKSRIGVHVHPTADWFRQSRIGYIRAGYADGGWECHVALPYQIARHMLDDVRREPDQIMSIGFSRTTGKDGKTAYPVYNIELSEPF